MNAGLIINLIAVVAIFYFVLIVPQRREQKRHQEMLAALRPGNEVATAGGIIGEIVRIDENRVTLKSGDARILIEKDKITRLIGA
jgi:preprotein translocase subunit YajC